MENDVIVINNSHIKKNYKKKTLPCQTEAFGRTGSHFLHVSPLAPPGGILMYGALLLFESEFVHVVAISFTALILTELLMVALTVRTWHWLMVLAEFLSLGSYLASLAFLNEYFGKY